MRLVPFDLRGLIPLLVAALLPFVLTMFVLSRWAGCRSCRSSSR